MNGTANEKYGLARSLSACPGVLSYTGVMAGDVLQLEVYAKYLDPVTTNWTAALTTLAGQINAGAAGVVIDGVAYNTSTASFPAGYAALVSETDNGAPKAYLNWLIFDRNFQFLTGGFKQITTAGKEAGTDVAHERVAPPDVTITQAGYVYVYLSNESVSQVEVYFDDFKVTQLKSPVVQTDEYYPFGLRYNSFSKENSVPNKRKLFQGQEHVDELDLNWDSFKWRNHQPDIGRFFNVDPISDKYYYNSPYAFSENKVVAHIELEGLESVTFQKDGEGVTLGVTGQDKSFKGTVNLNTGKVSVSQQAAIPQTPLKVEVKAERTDGGLGLKIKTDKGKEKSDKPVFDAKGMQNNIDKNLKNAPKPLDMSKKPTKEDTDKAKVLKTEQLNKIKTEDEAEKKKHSATKAN